VSNSPYESQEMMAAMRWIAWSLFDLNTDGELYQVACGYDGKHHRYHCKANYANSGRVGKRLLTTRTIYVPVALVQAIAAQGIGDEEIDQTATAVTSSQVGAASTPEVSSTQSSQPPPPRPGPPAK